MTRTVEVTELALRDGPQSLLATRMALEDMTPVCESLDRAGYWSVECWGGATYDACIRFLNEDPWERLRTFRRLLPHTRLQMLLRGQNLLGYRHYNDLVVDRFVEKSADNGIDVFRVFDALNDVRNLERVLAAVRRVDKHAEGAICYTISPLHTIEKFVNLAEKLREMGCDSVCIKDMAGLLRPQVAFDLVRGIKRRCGQDTVVHVHTHATTGMTLVSLMKAIEAGADIVDTCISSLSLGTGHNPTESLVEMLEGTPYTTRLDRGKLRRIRAHFAEVRPHYAALERKFLGVETEILSTQITSSMRSVITDQLQQQKADDRLKEVLAEVSHVRKDAGYPPLVTPCSQIVGTQSVLNILMGRYKVMTGEFADLMLGYYGQTPGERDPAVAEAAAKHAKKETCPGRPADLLQPEWDDLKSQALSLDGCNGSDEDVLTHALFPQDARKFFARRGEGPRNPSREEAVPAAPSAHPPVTTPQAEPRGPVTSAVTYNVKVGGKSHQVTVQPV